MKKITLLIVLLITSIGYSQTVLEDFEGTAPTLGVADGASASVSTSQAIGTKSLEIISAASGQPWQQTELLFQGDVIDLRTTKTATAEVYSTTAFTLLAKVISATNASGTGAGPDSATSDTHTGSGWETLTFNFASPEDGTVAANDAYQKILFLPNWAGNNSGNNATNNNWNNAVDGTYYIDNITGVAFVAPETCSDGILNNGETAIDCGGPNCTACPTASPTPSSYVTHLALLSDITDTGTFTNFWIPTYSFGESPVFIDFDATAGVNKAAKINLKIGWGGGINNGADVVTDVSGNDMVHIDYYIPNIPAGVNGHQFYLDLISRIGVVNTEAFYGFGTTVGGAGSGVVDEVIVFDSWQSIDIPLATFVGNGFDASNFLQFKIGAQSDIRTQLGYFDNIFFYKASTLSLDNNALLGFSMYPNPAANRLNISAKEVIQNAAVYNVLGKKVMSLEINKSSESIDISNLASGIYLIKYNVNDKVGTAKFIKQ
jgi:hypothetical protein